MNTPHVPPFVHLRLHTEYSISDGLLRIPELMEETARRKTPAVAVTDLNNLFAAVKFYGAALERGVKPIIGCELHVGAADGAGADEIVLLCADARGYHNLTRLVTRAYLEGQEHDTPHVRREWLADCRDGLIALSGGMRGDVGKALLGDDRRRLDQALAFWGELFDGRYYLELQSTRRAGEKEYIERALALAKRAGLPVVATNDVRFLRHRDFDSHEAKVCIGQGYTLADKRRPRQYSPEQYLKSAPEMARLFDGVPSALENTLEIATRCTLDLRFGKTLLPEFPLAQGVGAAEQITAAAENGLAAILAGAGDSLHRETYRKRLASELAIIRDMGYESYFLIVADFIAWAKREGIPVGPGRGSGAGSLVAYALGITELDPIRYDLLFERFLNPERVSMPDFDVDFCIEGRDRVIQYVAERYGRDRVSQIITFGSLGAKAAVRDVGRVLGHPYGFVDRIAKLIPNRLNITLKEALAESEELRRSCEDDDVGQIMDAAQKLEGLARNPGKHAGGVVISPTPMEDYTALYCEPGGGNAVTHFDMKDVEKIGLVKFDFLGLKTLTIIAKAVAQLRARGADVDIERIALDDPAVYRLLQRGDTAAIFQLESEGIRRLMKKLKPDQFDDIVALVALYRPGPLGSGMSDEYAERKHGARIRFPHPALKAILEPTYGVILYQEQVMQIARVLAGYTLGAADVLRRAMGKKIAKEMAEQRSVFVEGAVARGVEMRTATHIFDLMEKFADYGFNKSHSVAYALLAYRTAWLKANHPGAFMAAVLSAEMGDTDKIVHLIGECRAMKLAVEAPDVNRSRYEFAETEGGILFGLGAIRNVGAAAIEAIVAERERGGAFSSLRDFCARLVPGVGKNLLEALIRAGAFDSVERDRGAMLHHLARVYALAEQRANDRSAGQSDMFGEPPKGDDCPPLAPGEQIGRDQLLKMERDGLGLYLTDHPVAWYRRELAGMTNMNLHDARRLAGEDNGDGRGRGERDALWLAGVIMNIRVRYIRQGKAAFFTLDDGSGRLELALFDKDYANYADMLSHDDIVVVEVYRSAYDGARDHVRWRTRTILTLDQARRRFSKSVHIGLRTEDLDHRLAARLEESLAPFTDTDGCPVVVALRTADAETRLRFGDDWKVRPCEEMLCRLQRIAGVERVSFRY